MLNVGNRRREVVTGENGRTGSGIYGGISTLSLYNEAPLVEVSLEEFESFAIDRLHVLKAVETHRLRNVNNVKEQHQKEMSRLDKSLNKYLPLRGPTPSNPKRTEMDKLKDTLSHFILRMAFCQTEELRRWFLTHESALFRYRLDKLTREEKIQFMKQNGITYEEANPKEIEQRQSKLRAIPNANANANGIMRFHGTGSNGTSNGTSNASYFKVPFIEALDLVGNRKVYLEKGIAFVPFDHVVSILFARFRANLSQQLASAFRKFNRSIVSKDERLAPVLINLAKHHIGPDYSSIGQGVQGGGGAGDIKPEMIDTLASTSMPLCMKNLHQALKMQHHLKHGGRMQYGLFLKGAGLQLEDAISFWRQHFCKKMSVDDFNKKYAYNIRHNYGKEGKRKDYTPYNCMKIITGEPPKTGDYHGCPFRHHDEIHLLNQLKGIKEKNKQDILQLVQNRHYQIACKKYFEAIHPENEELEIMINHPNQFFEESRSYYASKAKQKQKNTNVLPSNFSSSSSSSTTTSTTSTTTTTTTTTQPLSQQKQQNPIAA